MELAGIGDRAQRDPDGVALVDDFGRLTWAELAEQVRAVAAEMLGVASGDGERVAVTGENVIPTLVAHAAGILAGVGTVAVSRQLTAGELADLLVDAGAVAAVTGPDSVDAVTAAAGPARLRAVVVHDGHDGHDGTDRAPGRTDAPDVIPWADWTGSDRPLPDLAARPARPPLVYTSGTTGRPRGTEVRWTAPTPATAVAYAAALAARSGFPAGPHLVVGPLQHNGPLTCLRHLLSGQPVVVLRRFDAERVLGLVDTYRVTSSVMVPTHFSRLLALPADVRARYDVTSLRTLPHTGSACPPDVKRAMIAWFGPVLVESYGGSEVGTLCRITSEEWLARPASVGRCVPPFEVVVLSADNAALPAGEVGVLGFRAPADRGIRYHDDPAKTAAAYLAPDVFTLGDVGYVDVDGYVHITDRIADMVVSGGVNLYPAESERILAHHPKIADVAVIGVPDPDMGEALRALVVPGGEAPAPDELDRFCRTSLAAYKCPKSYEIVAELPRNAMGKIDKKALRRPYWDTERTISG
ncbi:AMP-binding protein [Frankia sp. Cppng1_Ct_nod]|uniref:AMP-binding protein n=1 Tax=Frankia sp. Cppng1_Ct_nod TaxID=2897162 RepID=UPI001041AE14|nr:AMP-binding protein [Frankia sp. Cppng1_Ct_nod]